ncbi:hypothetical protein Nepgr_020450 [Nepenthes gracilis]|uniref:Uncharacterized protein n=1 Tax=Nepenthes gracilis TaxID=150966 RepID=A0AAD3SWZ9_NEPGR|nr:hypothetical protein Nepgr_020450 [Nepenthes gracilis]
MLQEHQRTSATRAEGFDKYGGLDGHVKGSGDLSALQRQRRAELGVAGHETGHFDLDEVYLEAAEVGMRHVLDLVIPAGGRFLCLQRHFCLSDLRSGGKRLI